MAAVTENSKKRKEPSPVSESPTELFIRLSKERHPDKFEYPESLEIKTASQPDKVELICKSHGVIHAVPRHHLQNDTGGCGACRAEKTSASKIAKSRQQWEKDIADPERQRLYDYSEFVFTKRDQPGTIICRRCNTRFPQAPNHHIDRNQDCPTCMDKQNALKQALPFNKFVDQSRKIHYNKYLYDKAETNYESLWSMIRIFCTECEEYFVQRAENHIRGGGHIVCGRLRAALAKISDTPTFVSKAKEVGRNNEICDYSETVYQNAKTKLEVICIPCEKKFWVTPNNHLRGKGCPYCYHHTSRAARDWLILIQVERGIELQTFDSDEGEFMIPGTKFKVDGYHAPSKTIFEFYGDYWHGNPAKYESDVMNQHTKCTMGELYRKTMDREQFLKDQGYQVVSIWENEWICS